MNTTTYANRRNIPNSTTPPNKPPILPKLSTNYDLLCKTKPIFLKSQMNVTKAITKDYAKRTLCQRGKNKANSNPIKANLQKAKINVNFYSTKDYENIANWTLFENKPNTKPIQTQTKPISNAKNNPAGSKKKGLFGVAYQLCSTLPNSSPIIRENKMLTESVFGEIMKFSLLMKVLRFLHVSERVKL